jgi:hypothetical protein
MSFSKGDSHSGGYEGIWLREVRWKLTHVSEKNIAYIFMV